MDASRHPRRWLALVAAAALTLTVGVAPASAHGRPVDKVPVATGYGGAVATVDADATRVGLDVLRRGGNAVDAAVAAAATLGVTEPFSSGIGGGGFFVYYDARSGQVHTIDGRETAPTAMQSDAFVEDGVPIPFADAVTSGLSVGVPGTPATWSTALDQWGSIEPAQGAAAGRPRWRAAASSSTRPSSTRPPPTSPASPPSRPRRRCSCPGRAAGGRVGVPQPRPGRRRTTCSPARASARSTPVGSPRTSSRRSRTRRSRRRSTLVARPGLLELRRPGVATRRPCASRRWCRYRGLDVYGMAPPSSGGSTVGEALNILEALPGTGRPDPDAAPLPRGERPGVRGPQPVRRRPRRRRRAPAGAAVGRVRRRAGLPDRPGGRAGQAGRAGRPRRAATPAAATPAPVGTEVSDGQSTTHLTTADRWGNVVAYTLTIESLGGNGIVVPGRGFLLNNELTDFNFTDTQGGDDPNLPGPGQAAAQLDGADDRPGRTASRCWRSGRPAARRSSRPSCRSS